MADLLSLLRIVVWVSGPVVGYLLAKYRGANPIVGAVIGILSCIGWALVFLLPTDKNISGGKALPSTPGSSAASGWRQLSSNVFAVPPELFRGDLPVGYNCCLYVGRMVGRLGGYGRTHTLQQFNFEIADAEDSTTMALRYVTYEAEAEELARWDNAGDKVGIVIASNGRHMAMVLAYNFARRKWFGTASYPHAKDFGLASRFSVQNLESFSRFSFFAVFLCGLGLVLLPIAYVLGASKTSQYKTINPSGYRGRTATKIADSITAHVDQIVGTGKRIVDPSL